jgi:TetR/AcrR family transcriptional repressor of nem operon
MLFNTCVEVAPHEPRVAAAVQGGIADIQEALSRALERARAQGSIPDDADVKALAMFLTSQMGGLVVMARAGASRGDMQTVADVALGALNPPRGQ